MRLLNQASAHVLSLYRIVLGLLFVCHGAATTLGVLGGAWGSGKALPAGQWPGWWAGVIQLVAGSLVLLGLLTRPAALLCSGSMAFAYFTVHQPQALWPIENHGELPVMFCWGFLLVAVLGPGAWSIDAALDGRTGRRWAPAEPAATQPVEDLAKAER
jgi:putative oxidoreductase